MRFRIYIDTSVIGGCHDREFSQWSIQLFDEFRSGSKLALISDLTYRELENAPLKVQKTLETLAPNQFEFVSFSEEAEELAEAYLKNKVVGPKHIFDAQHIAIATIIRADVLASWNFQQIVNLRRINAFNSINLKLGYPILEIRTPREVLDEKIF